MLVKKKNPEWQPSENRNLRVGETVEITDPKALILSGAVIPLAEDGVTELSAYELYGVLVKDEVTEFQEYLQMKKAEAQATLLKKEQEQLEAQLAESKKETEVKAAAVIAAEESKAVEPKKSK